MAHVRQQIRDKVKTLLTGLTTTGSNVFVSRMYPLQDTNLPGICIYINAEEVDDEEGKIERLQHRNAFITIMAKDKIIAGVDDKLDKIAAEVETALFADRFLSGLIFALDLVSTEVELNVEQEKPIGDMTMVFRAQYLTSEGTPETAT